MELFNAKRNMKYPVMITIIGSILLVLMLFLPFASAKGEYKEELKENSEKMYSETMTCGDAVNISLTEFIGIYSEIEGDIASATKTVIVFFIVLSGLTLIMSLCKKPAGIMLFAFSAMLAFMLIQADFSDRGVMSGDNYGWGVANFLTYIIVIGIFVGAVWLFIQKKKIKKLELEAENGIAEEERQ